MAIHPTLELQPKFTRPRLATGNPMLAPHELIAELLRLAHSEHMTYYATSVATLARELEATSVAYYARDPVAQRYVFRASYPSGDSLYASSTAVWKCGDLEDSDSFVHLCQNPARPCPIWEAASSSQPQDSRFVVCCRFPKTTEEMSDILPPVDRPMEFDHLGLLVAIFSNASSATRAEPAPVSWTPPI